MKNKQILQQFKNRLAGMSFSKATRYRYHLLVDRLLQQYHFNPKRVRLKEVINIVASMKRGGILGRGEISNGYLRQNIEALIVLFKFLGRNKLAQKLRTLGKSYKRDLYKFVREGKSPTEDDLKKCLSGLDNPRDRCLFLLFSTTGLRAGEVCALNRDDIKDDQIIVHGKGGKIATVPIDANVVGLIRKYLSERKDGNEALFVAKHGQRMYYVMCYRIIRRITMDVRKKGEWIKPHHLRHAFATIVARKTKDPFLVKKLMRHSSLKETMIYIDTLGDEEVMKGYEQGKPNLLDVKNTS